MNGPLRTAREYPTIRSHSVPLEMLYLGSTSRRIIPRGGTRGTSGRQWRLDAGSGYEVVDHAPGDAHLRRKLGELVRAVPTGVLDLAGLQPDLPSRVVGGEADHERVREGPRLAAEVPEVLDLDTDLLAHLAVDRLFYGLARLDETGEHAAQALREAGRAGEQDLIPPPHADDHGRADPRVVHHPAPGAPHRHLPLHGLRRPPAPAAEAVRGVPAHDLLRLPRHREKLLVHDGEDRAQVHERRALGRLHPIRHLRGPARPAVEVPDGLTKESFYSEIFQVGRPRHARLVPFEHEQPLVPEREPQRPLCQTLRRLARYSAGWRARRPVPSRICSLQLVPGATTTLPPASLTAGKSRLSPIFMETS